MKRVIFIVAFALSIMPLLAVGLFSNDTVFNYKNKTIEILDGDKDLQIIVFEINESGDTIRNELRYEAIYDDERVVEREYDNRFEISIPEVFRPKSKRARHFNSHWNGFGVGFTNLPEQTNFDGELASVVNSGTSLQYNLDIGDATCGIGISSMRIVLGMGIQFNSVHLQTNKAIEVVDYKSVITTTASGADYNTSRLHFTYLTVPLLLEYNSPGRGFSTFFINAGVVGKIKTASSSKVWYNEDGRKKKLKMPGELNIRPVSFDFIAQAGFGDFGVFATYSPLDLFMNNKGPKGNQVALGLKYYF